MLDTDWCYSPGSNRSKSAAPSTSSKINLNPSAVPTEKFFGIEVIGYKSEADVGLVQGFGRMGAALTPSNSEETFFGAPGFENLNDYLARKIKSDKYKAAKYTVATALNLWEAGSGLRKASLNFGVSAKYNTLTKATTPGGGLSGILGPFIFGYSAYRDETQLPIDLDPENPPKIQSIVETYSVGMYLNSLIIDYSSMRIQNSGLEFVDLISMSLFVKKWILSISQRTHITERPGYNFRKKELEFNEPYPVEYFYGAQYRLSKNFMAGLMYNYYLLREVSISMTLLF